MVQSWRWALNYQARVGCIFFNLSPKRNCFLKEFSREGGGPLKKQIDPENPLLSLQLLSQASVLLPKLCCFPVPVFEA